MDMKKIIINISLLVLPKFLRKMIFHFAFNIAQDEFEIFAYRYKNNPNMKLALEEVKGRGLTIDSILDIGAYEGHWSLMVNQVWPRASLTMIEANEDKTSILEGVSKRLNADYHSSLLGATDGKEVEYNIMESGSSIFEESSEFARRKQIRRLQRLDSLLPPSLRFDLIKIDTQGYELEILKGAGDIFLNAKAVILEVALIEINNGAPLLPDVINFMQENEFVTYEIVEIHRRILDRAMNQIDILFIKQDSFLISQKSFT